MTCAAVGPADAGGTKKTVIRLPSDVLFAFGSAELTPAAQTAIEAVDDDIGSGGSGTVTIEGHTDAIGSDPDNQALSERRAAAVRAALEPVLGSSYQYESVGFGETKPVAPNTKPDGSDDPDGRALNRRVEIRTGSVEAVPATLEPLPPTTDLSDAGLVAEVAGLERRGGYLMARVMVRNPTGETIPLGRGSGLTPNQARPGRAHPGRPHRPAPAEAVSPPRPRLPAVLPGQPEQRVRRRGHRHRPGRGRGHVLGLLRAARGRRQQRRHRDRRFREDRPHAGAELNPGHRGQCRSGSGPRLSTVRMANVLRASVTGPMARIWSSSSSSYAPRSGTTASTRKSASPDTT